MDAVWRGIEAWLQAHAVDLLGSLRVGATADEIARAEAVLRVKLPADVRASYRLHNGQQAAVRLLVIVGGRLGPSEHTAVGRRG